MGFTCLFDRDYRCAKRIKQGKSRLDPVYDAFAERFRERFGVRPLSVILDTSGRRPRLGITIERTAQYRAVRERAGPDRPWIETPFHADRGRQKAVAVLLTESLQGRARIRADDVYVYFYDFERAAKKEVHERVTRSERGYFAAGLGIADQFWCVQQMSGAPVVFVQTDEQARALQESALPERWADSYFELARRHDEFGYLSRDEIWIRVDSRENFELNYSGNWYTYFK